MDSFVQEFHGDEISRLRVGLNFGWIFAFELVGAASFDRVCTSTLHWAN